MAYFEKNVHIIIYRSLCIKKIRVFQIRLLWINTISIDVNFWNSFESTVYMIFLQFDKTIYKYHDESLLYTGLPLCTLIKLVKNCLEIIKRNYNLYNFLGYIWMIYLLFLKTKILIILISQPKTNDLVFLQHIDFTIFGYIMVWNSKKHCVKSWKIRRWNVFYTHTTWI